MVTAAAPGGPLVSRAEGQQLARTELSKAIYHQQPGESLIQRISDWINHLLSSTGVGAPAGGWWAIVALAAVLIIVVAVVLHRIGPVARSRATRAGPLLSDHQLTAREHREQAERLAAAGDFTGAIIESLRAIAVDLEERGVLPPRIGRTAAELAAEASRPLPGQATGLAAAARLFDDVRYGGRNGTAAGHQQLRDLDAAIRAARPAPAVSLAGALGPPS
jgi:hypothetical protein